MAPASPRIRLLGGLDLRQGQAALPPLRAGLAESLLAFLLLHQEAAQPRQHLAFLPGPDSSEGQARTNLRHLLHVLRRALPEADRFLEVTPRDAPVAARRPLLAGRGRLRRRPRPVRSAGPAGRRPPWPRPWSCTRATCSRAATTSGWATSGSGSASATSKPWSGWSSCWRRGVDLAAATGARGAAAARGPLREPTYQVLDAAARRSRGPGAGPSVYHRLRGHPGPRARRRATSATRRAYAALLPALAEPAPTSRACPAGRSRAADRAGRPAGPAGRPVAEKRARRAPAGAGHRRAGRRQDPAGRGAGGLRAQSGAATAEARSYPAEGALAYGPAVAWLRSDPDRLPPGAARPAAARRAGPAALELAPAGRRPPPRAAASTAGRRRLLFEALAQAVATPAGRCCWSPTTCTGPTPETVAFLYLLLRSRPQARLLVVANARDEHLGDQHPAARPARRVAGPRPAHRDRGRAASPRRRRPPWPGGWPATSWSPPRPSASSPRPRATRCSWSRPWRAGWLDRPGERDRSPPGFRR